MRDWVTGTILPAYLGADILQTDAYDVYRELDRLSRQEAELQSFVYRQLKLQRPEWSETFFYDITVDVLGRQSVRLGDVRLFPRPPAGL